MDQKHLTVAHQCGPRSRSRSPGPCTEFAAATRFVLWGMAVALAIALVISLFHPGGQVEDDTATADETATGAVPPPEAPG